MLVQTIEFPNYTGTRCLMMPYIQGDAKSVPQEYSTYSNIIESVYLRKGDIGYLLTSQKCLKGSRTEVLDPKLIVLFTLKPGESQGLFTVGEIPAAVGGSPTR